MAMYTIQDSTLSNIADAIRNNLYTTSSSMTPLEMPSYIEQAIAYDQTDNENIYYALLMNGLTSPYICYDTEVSIIGSYKFFSHPIKKAIFFNCQSICTSAFYFCIDLKTAYFPNCTYIAGSAFDNCISLATISFPNCSYIGCYAFYNCYSLTAANFPNCESIINHAFYKCYRLATVNFPKCSYISDSAFYQCSNLMSIYLLSTSIVSLVTIRAFYSTPISSSGYTGTYGSIYVPASLLTSYQIATNWSYYSSRFVGI